MAITVIHSINAKTVAERHPIKRVDYRDERVFTIDNPDCKSHDDAIGITTTGKGWRLAIHITDVADEVSLNSDLDRKEVKRSLKKGSFPMFRKTLAKNDFSILQGETRKSMAFILYISYSGEVYKTELNKGLIRSRVNGEFKEVDEILNADEENPVREELKEKYGSVIEDLKEMKKLCAVLISKRTGKNISKYENKVSAHGIISEFMTLTNMFAGEYLCKNGLPAFFRVVPKTTRTSTEIVPGINIEAYSQVTSPIRDLESLKTHQILTAHLKGYSAAQIHDAFDEQLTLIRQNTLSKHFQNGIAA